MGEYVLGNDEYVVPGHGTPRSITGGSMPRAAKDKGGIFEQRKIPTVPTPGPGWYNKEIFNGSWVSHMTGGSWNRKNSLTKKLKPIMPSVGQYDTDPPLGTQHKKRAKGGMISKLDRRSIFGRQSENVPDPCKYNPKFTEAHLDSPVMSKPKNVSRVPKIETKMGPGYYKPQFEPIEKKVLVYSGGKEDARSFQDKMNSKNATPGPGYLGKDGIPESTVEDRCGKALHSARLLMDRPCVPRSIDSAR